MSARPRTSASDDRIQLQQLIEQLWPDGGAGRSRYPGASAARRVGALADSIASGHNQQAAPKGAAGAATPLATALPKGRGSRPPTGRERPETRECDTRVAVLPLTSSTSSDRPASGPARKPPASSASSTVSSSSSSSARRCGASADAELRGRIEAMRMKRDDVGDNVDRIKDLCDVIKEGLKRSYPGNFRWERYNSGSYFEKTKIRKPDEYDCMFACEIRVAPVYRDLDIESKSYCALKMPNAQYWEPAEVLCHKGGDWFVCPKAFLEFFQENVENILKDNDPRLSDYKIEIQSNSGCSPAVTLSMRQKYRRELISVDIVPAVRILEWPRPAARWRSRWLRRSEVEYIRDPSTCPVFAVAKVHPSEFRKSSKHCRLWRLSFSAPEKEIMLHADGWNSPEDQRTCRKDVLRLLKSDLTDFNANNAADDICSYYMKSIVLLLWELKPDPEDWSVSSRRSRYVDALTMVVERLKERSIPHYFIDSENLLAEKGVTSRRLSDILQFFRDRLERYKE